MKTFLASLLILASFLAGFPATAQAQQKIATIDLKKVFDDFYKTKIADAQIREEAGVIAKDRKALTEQGQKLIGEYKKAVEDANNQAISTEEREKRKKAAEGKLVEVNELEQQIKTFDRTADANLGEKQGRFREKILKEIQTIVNTKAKAGGYTLVLDSAAEGASRTFVVFYNSGQDDITAAVLKELNANAPADLPKTDKDDKNGAKEEKK
jgi:outer membrane protein